MTFFRPAWIDSLGPFNLNPVDRFGDDPPDPDVFAEFVYTVQSPPPLAPGELNSVEEAAKAYLDVVVPGTNYGRKPWGPDPDGDRTLRLVFRPASGFTAEIAHYLQDMLCDRYPLWRVAILAETIEDAIVIYPDAVVIGRTLYRADWDAKLEEAVAAEDERRRYKNRYFHAQIAIVERHIRSSPLPRDPRYEIVAVFDNYNGDKSRYAIWLVTSGEHSPYCVNLDGADVWNGDSWGFDVDRNWTDWTYPDRPRPVGFAYVKLASKAAKSFKMGLLVPLERTIEHEFVVDVDSTGEIVQEIE